MGRTFGSRNVRGTPVLHAQAGRPQEVVVDDDDGDNEEVACCHCGGETAAASSIHSNDSKEAHQSFASSS